MKGFRHVVIIIFVHLPDRQSAAAAAAAALNDVTSRDNRSRRAGCVTEQVKERSLYMPSSSCRTAKAGIPWDRHRHRHELYGCTYRVIL